MKTFLVSIFIVFTFSGCFSAKVILVPQVQYYPQFSTVDFNTSKKYTLDIWEECDNNSTYIVGYKEDMLEFFKSTKILRSDYNVLLRQLKKFNLRIDELNKKQAELKPQTIE